MSYNGEENINSETSEQHEQHEKPDQLDQLEQEEIGSCESCEPCETDAEVKIDETETDDKNSRRALNIEIKNLKKENKKNADALAELEDRYLRMIAEYDNYRRRSAKDRDSVYSDAYADALKEILPVIDNLERALTFADTENTDDKLTEGVVMTLNQFNDALNHMGVVPVGVKGENFDPEYHDAVMHEEDETKGANLVDEVLLKGYKRDDRVIRYAMVKVVN
ncbi:MAG: nucleotide exchange factor GrpE [Eubacteriales bacterium]|jgi:molecular chaperone GrpE|nr:nucleotide exchange factor GrpE [Eubacteriales bacterium]